jgi:hypothetical protein
LGPDHLLGMRVFTILVLAAVGLSGCSTAKPLTVAAPAPSRAVATNPSTTLIVATSPTTQPIAVTAPPTTTVPPTLAPTTIPESPKAAVLAAYEAYVSGRESGSGAGVGPARYRLQSAVTGQPAEQVTLHGVRLGKTTAAVEECAGGVERLVVLELMNQGWAVSHVLGPDTDAGWC